MTRNLISREEIVDFFAQYLSDYEFIVLESLWGRNIFYFNSFKNLSVLAMLPFRLVNGEHIRDGNKLRVFLKITSDRDSKRSVKVLLRDTCLNNGWQDTLVEKIRALEMLIQDVGKCSKCGNYYVPLTCKNGKFVSTKCFSCGEWKPTTYGICLKKLLHKHLIDPKSIENPFIF